MNLNNVIQFHEKENYQDQFQYFIIAAITQVFSYMICAKLKYEYICTNKAFIFLQVFNDLIIVYYFLSVSKSDVREITK